MGKNLAEFTDRSKNIEHYKNRADLPSYLATPKSPILQVPSSVSRMFLVFRSRCMISMSCKTLQGGKKINFNSRYSFTHGIDQTSKRGSESRS